MQTVIPLLMRSDLTILALGTQAAKDDLPSLEDDIAAGSFSGLKSWLNAKIHRSGSLYPSGDGLMRAATGSPLDPSVFLRYLRDKYTKLYKL